MSEEEKAPYEAKYKRNEELFRSQLIDYKLELMTFKQRDAISVAFIGQLKERMPAYLRKIELKKEQEKYAEEELRKMVDDPK